MIILYVIYVIVPYAKTAMCTIVQQTLNVKNLKTTDVNVKTWKNVLMSVITLSFNISTLMGESFLSYKAQGNNLMYCTPDKTDLFCVKLDFKIICET